MLKTLVGAQVVVERIAVQEQRENVALGAGFFQPTECLILVANTDPGPRVFDSRNVPTPTCFFVRVFNTPPCPLTRSPLEITLCEGAAQPCGELVVPG